MVEVVYKPRKPKVSPLYQSISEHFSEFDSVYEERYQKRYGVLRDVVILAIELLTAGSQAADGAGFQLFASRSKKQIPIIFRTEKGRRGANAQRSKKLTNCFFRTWRHCVLAGGLSEPTIFWSHEKL